jgi:hypothetical protein
MNDVYHRLRRLVAFLRGWQRAVGLVPILGLLPSAIATELSSGQAAELGSIDRLPTLKGAPWTQIFRVIYECKGDMKSGTGCSAGCASASFSPLIRLSTVLYATNADGVNPNTVLLYYLVDLPPPKARRGTGDANVKPVQAEGFVLNSNSVCGTVNMTRVSCEGSSSPGATQGCN